jgi:hypothetical protein
MARGKTASSAPERIKAVLCDPAGPREIELVKTDDGRWVEVGLAKKRAREALSSLGKRHKKNIRLRQNQNPWLLATGARVRRQQARSPSCFPIVLFEMRPGVLEPIKI